MDELDELLLEQAAYYRAFADGYDKAYEHRSDLGALDRVLDANAPPVWTSSSSGPTCSAGGRRADSTPSSSGSGSRTCHRSGSATSERWLRPRCGLRGGCASPKLLAGYADRLNRPR
jgi:hypothetical protein